MPPVPLRADCKVHRRYQAKRKPRTLCEACWAKWTLKHWQLWHWAPEPRKVYRATKSVLRRRIRVTGSIDGGFKFTPYDVRG